MELPGAQLRSLIQTAQPLSKELRDPIAAIDESLIQKAEQPKGTLDRQLAWYNFIRVRNTLPVTPIMGAGVAGHIGGGGLLWIWVP